MFDGVFVKSYVAPPVDKREILRYAGCRGEADGRTEALFAECLQESENAFSYRVCYRIFKATELLRLLGEDAGKLPARRLCGAEYAAVFAATVGVGIDRLILRYTELSPAKSLMMQAIGAERIEGLCEEFCKELAKDWEAKGLKTGARFSAGYGDFPLTVQREIFKWLDCERKIGVTLNGSLLMTPTKSVTAIVPIGKTPQTADGCQTCGKRDCAFRKTFD